VHLEEFMRSGGADKPPVELKKYERIGFGTTTGKVELYSTILEKLGYDPLPSYREPPETPVSQPELAKEYPLILLTGARHKPFYHTEHRQVESLRKRHPNPIVQIHPETARDLGIADGDWVWIETARAGVDRSANSPPDCFRALSALSTVGGFRSCQERSPGSMALGNPM